MNRFDESFDHQPYPAHLLRSGWRSLGAMIYVKGDMEILFDTSTAFTVHRKGEILGSHSPVTHDDFVAILGALV